MDYVRNTRKGDGSGRRRKRRRNEGGDGKKNDEVGEIEERKRGK